MTTLLSLLKEADQAKENLARMETRIRLLEREYWTTRGFSVLPRRERLKAALLEDAAMPTPLEAWIESVAK